MRKSAIAAAMTLILGTGAGQAAQEITVTTMEFYDATGTAAFFGGGLNTSVAGSMNNTATGSINSNGTNFLGTAWAANQSVWFDTRNTPLNWSGTSASGAYSYNFTLTGNQVAAGMLFTWGAAVDIAVLQIFDCGAAVSDPCTGVHNFSGDDLIAAAALPHADHLTVPGSVMGNGPFAGQHAAFKGILAVAPNQLPVANDVGTSTVIDTPLPNLDIVANDTDAEDGSPPPVPPAAVTLLSGTTTLSGSVTDNGDGTVNYTPPAGVSGATDTFQYTLTDSDGDTSSTATVSINLLVVANTPPVANDLNVATNEDTPLVTFPISNDTDADGDTLSLSSFDSTSAQGGAVTDNGSNSLLYTPLANFFGSDSYGYVVADGNGGTDSATVFITVNAVNDVPVCTDVTLNTALDTALAIDVTADLLATCSDADNDTLSLDSTSQPNQGGILSFDGANTLTYTPPSGFIGEDTFTYTVTDGTATNTNTVMVNVGKIFGNFTMIDASGSTFGGTNDIVATWDRSLNTDVASTNFNMTIATDKPEPFFGKLWVAHHIRAFGPGSYGFDTSCTTAQLDAGVSNCGGAADEILNLTIPAGQNGAHVLFDWSGNNNIDVVLLWDADGVFTTPAPGILFQGDSGPTPPLDAVYELVSRDADGDGIAGARMIDGPFIDFRANFNLNFTRSSGGGTIDVPTSSITNPSLGGQGCTIGSASTRPLNRADWLLVSGFIAWLGIAVSRRRRRPLR